MRNFATRASLIALLAGSAAFGQLPSMRRKLAPANPATQPVFAYTGGASWFGGSGGSDVTQGCVAAVPNPPLNVPPAIANGLPPGLFNGCKTQESLNTSYNFNALNVNESVAGIATWRAAGNMLSTTLANNTFPAIESALGEFSSSSTYYYQEGIPAPAGSTLNLTFPVSGVLDNRGGFSFARVTLWTDGPDGGTYGGAMISAPDAIQSLILDPFVIGPSGTYTILAQVETVINNGLGTEKMVLGCGVDAKLLGNSTPNAAGVARPLDGVFQEVATNCGYIGFDWQQSVTNLPCPNPFVPAVPGNLTPANFCGSGSPTPNSLTASSFTPDFADPVQGGYTYLKVASTGLPYDPYPFYWPATNAINGTKIPALLDGTTPTGNVAINIGDTLMVFADSPSDPCLPTGPLIPTFEQLAARQTACGGMFNTAPPGSYLGFTTAFVGILPDGTASAPLFEWTWTDTWNGLTGGISGLSALGPADPGTGVGNITITSIDGIPVPPVVPAAQLSVKASGLAYSRVTGTFNGTVTVTNTGGTAITTPTAFQLLLNSLPDGVTLANASGAFNEGPYVTVPQLVNLMPNQSVTVAVQFRNSSNAAINFTSELYAGSFQ